MGSRANFVYAGSGSAALYYDHWAAQTIAVDAILAGPDATIQRIESMKMSDMADSQSWLDDRWAEGCMFVIEDMKAVYWFGDELEALPRYYNWLIESTWPGWTAAYSPTGMAGILSFGEAIANIDPAIALSDNPLPTKLEPERAGALVDYEAGRTIISVTIDGYSYGWLSQLSISDVLGISELQLVQVAADVLENGWELSSSNAPWRFVDAKLSAYPTEGIHLDLDSRQAKWWSYDRCYLTGFIDEGLSTFAVESHSDYYEWHQSILALELQPPVDVVCKHLAHRLQSIADNPGTENPGESIATLMRERGTNLELSPSVSEHKPSAADHSKLQRAQGALEVLAESGQKLRPGAYITSRGTIVDFDEDSD